jgi:hypothetical protein
MSTTFYDHLRVLNASTEETLKRIFTKEQNSSLVEQRRFFLMRHMVGAQFPYLLHGGSAAAGTTAHVHKTPHNAEMREQTLLNDMLSGLVKTLKSLAPRAGGRNTNARTVLRRALLVGLLSGVKRGQYSEAARLLSSETEGVHMRTETIRQHARYLPAIIFTRIRSMWCHKEGDVSGAARNVSGAISDARGAVVHA